MPAVADVLLDTSVLVHMARRSAVWDRIQRQYRLLLADPAPGYCVVTAGELRAFARQRGWAGAKLGQVNFALTAFTSVTIDEPALIEKYAEISAAALDRGRAIGQNDLWIAATAATTGATLVTTDRDFAWLTPEFIRLDFVDPAP